MASPILVLVVALYGAVATAYAEARRRTEARPAWARHLGALAVAAHLGGLVALAVQMDRSPFANASQALSFLAFSLVALYLLLEATSRVSTHGGWFYATAAVLAALSVPGLIAVPPDQAAEAPRDTLRSLHVGLALLSTAAVLAGALLATGYLTTYARVKGRRVAPGDAGPSLQGFERLARRASLLGALLLVPALGLGLDAWQRASDPAPMGATVGAMAALLGLLTAAFWIWWRRPLKGSLAAWLNLAGAALLLVTFALVHPLGLAQGGR